MSFDNVLYNPIFNEEWEQYFLYDLAAWKNGLAFRNINFSEKGKPVIKIAELKNGLTDQTKYTEQVFDPAYYLKKNDLLFSWSGSPETSIDAYWYDLPEGWLNQHIFKVIPNKEISIEYLFYIIKYLKPLFISIAKNKQTTGLGHVTVTDLKNMMVRIPKRSEQNLIAEVLASLDNKIRLNNYINKTLEEMAQEIFKSWFVNFNPFLDGEFENSELGNIPKGWQTGVLGDIAVNLKNSIKPEDIPADVPYIGLEHMPRKCIALSAWENNPDLSSNKYRFKQGDILFGKLRPYFHKVGFAMVDGVCSTDILVINPKQPHWYGIILCYISSNEFIDYTNATSTGTKMPRTSWSDMARYKVLIPSKEIASNFNNIINPMLKKIRANVLENHILTNLRDTLLPKLISGEIRVPVDTPGKEAD